MQTLHLRPHEARIIVGCAVLGVACQPVRVRMANSALRGILLPSRTVLPRLEQDTTNTRRLLVVQRRQHTLIRLRTLIHAEPVKDCTYSRLSEKFAAG